MDIHTYLHYNNVALIDPQDEFQASCMKQYEAKGYLSPNQLLSLRNWAHSVSAIERLTASAPKQASTQVITPTTSTAPASVKTGKWTDDEINDVLTQVNSGITDLEELANTANRAISAVQNMLYRNGTCTIKKGKVIQFEQIPF